MTMTKRMLSLMFALLLVFASACSSNKGGNDASPSVEASKPAESVPADPSPSETAEPVDPFGKYPEQVTFKTIKAIGSNPQLPEGESYEENKYNKFIEEQLNVKPQFVWTAPQDGFAYMKKLQLAIAANDIPDMFQILGDTNALNQTLKRLVDADMIEDLTNVYDQYASPQIKAAFAAENNRTLDAYTIDGKLYAIPEQRDISDYNFVWIRDDWRKKLDLPEPKTIEDVIEIAKAFKEKDPAGGGKTVPITMQMQTEPTGLFGGAFIFDQFNSFPRLFYKDTSGNLVYGGIEPQTKDALILMAQMYKDGLFKKDFALDDSGKGQELLASGNSGMVGQAWWAVWYPLFMTLQNNPDADWKPYVILGKNGKFNMGATSPTQSILVVKKGFKYPELPMKWLNVFNANRDSEYFMKLEQEDYAEANDKNPIWLGMTIDRTDAIRVQAGDIVAAVNGELDASKLPFKNKDAYDHISKYINELKDQPQAPSKNMLQWQNTRSWYDAMGGANKVDINTVYSAYNGRTPTMDKKLTALEELQMNTYLEIIMNKTSDVDGAFDKFVSAWKSQGGDQILAEIAQEIAK